MVDVKNKDEEKYRVLSPGKVYFNYGPVSMVVSAFKNETPLTELCCKSFEIIDAALKEITESLEILRLYNNQIPDGILAGLPLLMHETVKKIKEPNLTPMSTAAGAISDKVADWLFQQGATKVIVNNGGDIALRLAKGESIKLGLISSLKEGKIDKVVTIKEEDNIGGIATSGLGGRGFTCGIAEGVTVITHSAIMADALATHIANKSYIESEKVAATLAGNINATSDIKDLNIVISVDKLTEREENMAIENINREVLRQKEIGNLFGLYGKIQNKFFEFKYPILK